jgi:hypothetical protein
VTNSLLNQYLAHLDSLIQTYAATSQDTNGRIPDRIAYGLLTSARTAIEKISGKQSYYTQHVEEIIAQEWHVSYKVELVIGIVEALHTDILNGYLESFSKLVRGELFQNFLDMADYLCQQGYKDAAAVIAGSTLEAHLRQLCQNYNLDISSTASDGSVRPKKASQLNQELNKVAYSLFDHKQVTAWLDLRNSAAHGKYDEYTTQQVIQFIEWLKDFMARNPA